MRLSDFFQDPEVLRRLDALRAQLTRIEEKVTAMAGELDTLTKEVTGITEVVPSAIALLTQLHDLLVAAGTDPVKLQALADTLRTQKEALAAAIVANTPAAG